ncbi:hypothetical protein CLOSTASPAR_00535 [[Clostridium] asparagiforme DSM 15981]|uniref:Uncharacterized protein n=1 Tax=[Clostridium] asparagiforme DSM 15981 TaxID=518636 RepID=C0CU86_9FIRM|nr:hypothetical protein CLOSTASPAR_00535 [[Clostridium] asparagiforme DSM 15981]
MIYINLNVKIKQIIQLSLQRMRDDGKSVDFRELVCLLTEVSFLVMK